MLSWNHHSECKRKRAVSTLRSSHLYIMCVFCLCVVFVIVSVAAVVVVVAVAFLVAVAAVFVSRLSLGAYQLCGHCIVRSSLHYCATASSLSDSESSFHSPKQIKWKKKKKTFCIGLGVRSKRDSEVKSIRLNAMNAVSVAYTSDIRYTVYSKGTRSFFFG